MRRIFGLNLKLIIKKKVAIFEVGLGWPYVGLQYKWLIGPGLKLLYCSV